MALQPKPITLLFSLGKGAVDRILHWFDVQCSNDTLQIKTIVEESRSRGVGEYMCIKLERRVNNVLGILSRECKLTLV